MASQTKRPDAIRFTGSVPHDKISEQFAAADVFVFPSIREFGGAVVLEAMAMGAVPIVVDYGGPGELVPAGCGYRVPIGPRTHIVSEIRTVLLSICVSRFAISTEAAILTRAARAVSASRVSKRDSRADGLMPRCASSAQRSGAQT